MTAPTTPHFRRPPTAVLDDMERRLQRYAHGSKEIAMVASAADKDFTAALADFTGTPTLRSLEAGIERLHVSADVKAFLLDIAQVTLKVGDRLLAFGRKILTVVFELASRFQNITFGVIIALVLSAVLGSIPILGPAIAALLTPLMLAFGITAGALRDFREVALRNEIDALARKMAILSGHAVI